MSIELIRPQWRAPAGTTVVATTRSGGASSGVYSSLDLGSHVGDTAVAVAENRARLARLTGVGEVGWLNQVHGIDVVRLKRPLSRDVLNADAAWTSDTGLACVVLTADCLPVVVAHTQGACVGVAHCGWRGLLAGVLENFLSALPCAPGELQAWLGPGICGDCYEVEVDVFDAVRAACGSQTAARVLTPGKPGKWLFSLSDLARIKLVEGGVASVCGGDFCTLTDRRFYSYRRDGVTGRLATLAWLGDAL